MNDIKVKIGNDFYKPYTINANVGLANEVTRLELEVLLTESLKVKPISIKDVIFNRPATIVFWSDGTKTVVKSNDEAYDKEKGLAMAISKKFFWQQRQLF